MNNYHFSVVVPVYQKGNYVEKCINSVLCQNYPFYEIILVDDGSTDNSGKICDDYAAKYSQIHVYHKKNTGVSDTRNYGISKSTNPYIAFLDADDFWDMGFLSEIAKLIQKYPQCGMYSTNFYKICFGHLLENETEITGDCVVDNYFKQSLYNTIVNSSNVVIKKNLLLEVGGFPVGMIDAEDLYTWVKIASISKCAYSDKKLSYYNLESEGWRLRKNKKDVDGYNFKQLLTNEDDFYKKEYLSKLAYKKAVYYLINGFKKEADIQIKPFMNSKLFKLNMIKYRLLRLIPSCWILKAVLIDASIVKRINKYFKT